MAIAGRKRRTASLTIQFAISRFRPSLDFDSVVKRAAVCAVELRCCRSVHYGLSPIFRFDAARRRRCARHRVSQPARTDGALIHYKRVGHRRLPPRYNEGAEERLRAADHQMDCFIRTDAVNPAKCPKRSIQNASHLVVASTFAGGAFPAFLMSGQLPLGGDALE